MSTEGIVLNVQAAAAAERAAAELRTLIDKLDALGAEVMAGDAVDAETITRRILGVLAEEVEGIEAGG